jgi:hypothetical protein
MWFVHQRNPQDLQLAERFHAAVDECSQVVAELAARYALPLGETEDASGMSDDVFSRSVATTSNPYAQPSPRSFYEQYCNTPEKKQSHRREWLETLLAYTSRFRASPNRPVREVELETHKSPQHAYRALAARLADLSGRLASIAAILAQRGDSLVELKAMLPHMRAWLEERKQQSDDTD